MLETYFTQKFHFISEIEVVEVENVGFSLDSLDVNYIGNLT